jgi:hypothetical protein
MKITFRARLLAAFAVAVALVVLLETGASAHVASSFGPIHMEMGFGNEPTYAGQPNSVFLGIDRGGRPVTDLTDTLKVTVSFGTQHLDLPVVPNFEVGGDGTPGDYRAWFVPSQPGKYTFHVFGTVDGTKIDWTETSSPSTFNTVQDPNSAFFPKVSAPTNQQLSDLITAQTTRLQAAAGEAHGAANSARTVGEIGVVLGAIAAIAAIGALAIARKRR